MRRVLHALVAAVALTAGALSATRVDAVSADPAANADELGFGCYDDPGPGCTAAALAAFDAARAREGLGPMTLPTNYPLLSPAQQLMVVANIDRVDRGLIPIAGVSSALQPSAQDGATRGVDPAFPAWATEGGSNWFGGRNPLAAEYFFMYDDGPGSSNIDCSASNPGGCWGHRHNILGDWHRPLLLGAASGQNGVTQLLMGTDTHDTADVARWSDELGYFPIGVRSTPVVVGAGPSAVAVPVWASGRAMDVTASVTGRGWSVSPRRCSLAAGRQCTLTVHHQGGGSSGRLTLHGPNGPVGVALSTGSVPPRPHRVAVRVHGRTAIASWRAPRRGGVAVTGWLLTTNTGLQQQLPAKRRRVVIPSLPAGRISFQVRGLSPSGPGPASLPRVVTIR